MEFEKVVVLDTNVLIEDYNAISKFPDTLVVIPRVVISELDGLKNSAKLDVRSASRRVSNILDYYTEEFFDEEYIPLETKGSYLIIDDKYRNEINAVEPDKPDNIIVSTAVGYAKQGCQTTMLSMDTNVRLDARVFARNEKMNNLKAKKHSMSTDSLRDMSTGVQNAYLPSKKIQELRSNKSIDLDLPYINGEHILAIDEDNPANIILSTYDETHKKIRTIVDYKKGSPIWNTGNEPIRPTDARQSFLADDILNPEKHIHFVLSRVAGAGKNFITTACALKMLNEGIYDRMLVIKPMIEVEGQGTGYLPGDKDEKLAPWFASFKDTMIELTSDGQTLDAEIEAKIELDVVTHMRGRSIPRTIMIIDEAQNFSEGAIKTLLTRAGKDTKIILLGDLTQIDNFRLDADNNGLRIWAERSRNPESGYANSTYIMLDSNFRSELSAWASSFYE